MNISELKNIAESYGLEILNKKSIYAVVVNFEDYPGFWDEDYIHPNELVSALFGELVVNTSLKKDKKTGKYVLSRRRTYSLKDYTTSELYNLINRISKSIKKELIQYKISKIEKDFQ